MLMTSTNLCCNDHHDGSEVERGGTEDAAEMMLPSCTRGVKFMSGRR